MSPLVGVPTGGALTGRLRCELELELLAVLVVPVPADLAEAEPAHERERRLVLRPDRGDEAMDPLRSCPVEQRTTASVA